MKSPSKAHVTATSRESASEKGQAATPRTSICKVPILRTLSEFLKSVLYLLFFLSRSSLQVSRQDLTSLRGLATNTGTPNVETQRAQAQNAFVLAPLRLLFSRLRSRARFREASAMFRSSGTRSRCDAVFWLALSRKRPSVSFVPLRAVHRVPRLRHRHPWLPRHPGGPSHFLRVADTRWLLARCSLAGTPHPRAL